MSNKEPLLSKAEVNEGELRFDSQFNAHNQELDKNDVAKKAKSEVLKKPRLSVQELKKSQEKKYEPDPYYLDLSASELEDARKKNKVTDEIKKKIVNSKP